MALITCEYFSDELNMMRSMRILLPQEVNVKNGVNGENARHGNLPVLYLLNGLSDDDSAWIRRTSIERYAMKWNIAVVMPNGERGWYTDAVHGYKYYSHIAHEVPRIARSFFPLSNKREDNFIAGLSMGGYGAIKIALLNPKKFSVAASLSGALNIKKRYDGIEDKLYVEELKNIYGDLERIDGTDNDLLSLVQKCDPAVSPKILQCCGTEDFLYSMNQEFLASAKKSGFEVDYWEGSGGHFWEYWDAEIQNVLRKLPIIHN